MFTEKKINNTNDDLNLSDLNLKQLKLSEEDAIALSYLTPGLSRRIQKQLLAQLPPSEAKKLTRTMSMRSSKERTPIDLNNTDKQKGTIEKNQTLPRRFPTESIVSTPRYNSTNKIKSVNDNLPKSESLHCDELFREKSVTRNYNRDVYSPFTDRSTRSESLDMDRAPRPRAMRSTSLREPRLNYTTPRIDSFRSPDSSISDTNSFRNDDIYKIHENSKENLLYNSPNASSPTSKTNNTCTTDFTSSKSPTSVYSPYSPESSTLNKYLSLNKYSDGPRSYSPTYTDVEKKTESSKRPSTTTRKISRFLRPDFYDKSKEENVVVKEKKEREMETQKVLKEIRDKRKNRLQSRRERSTSREASSKKSEDELEPTNNANLECDRSNEASSSCDNKNNEIARVEDTNQILNNISNSIKNIETNITSAVVVNETLPPEIKAPKKDKISKLIRPKSYPAENLKKDANKATAEKEVVKSKIAKIKKDTSNSQNAKSEEKTKSPPPQSKVATEKNKNRFFQTIEKKIEKLRSFNNNPSRENSVEKKVKEEKKSAVENTIKRLREQSLPRNMDHCITESGLIKRAVSVEDLSTLNTNPTKQLQPSRKSVTKILGLFKKYEEKDKKAEKASKLKKPKEVSGAIAEKTDGTKLSQLKKADKKVENKGAEKTVISKLDNNNKVTRTSSIQKLKSNDSNGNGVKDNASTGVPEKDLAKKPASIDQQEEKERPKSLLCDFQKGDSLCKGARSDTAICNDNKVKLSKLPINSFRRSLNLDKTPEPSLKYKNSNRNSLNDQDDKNNNPAELDNLDVNENRNINRPDRRNLKLDLSKITDSMIETLPSTSNSEPNRNSATTDESSVFLSPCDDNMSCDSWSVCSDHHTHDLLSPISPNGHIYSGDEGESVIDRIRRKSFYTRFNEKKRPRKPSLIANYRDLDLYSQRKPSGATYRSPNDYGSLDRRSVDYRAPSAERRLSYNAVQDNSVKRDYKPYVRSSSLLNDYVNVPNRYQTYNPRMGRHISSLYSPEREDSTTMDDVPSAGKSRL